MLVTYDFLAHSTSARKPGKEMVYIMQAIGATTPLCTAILAFVMLGQTESRRVYLALIPVVAGVVLATGDAAV